MVGVVFKAWFMTINHLSREKWLHTNKAFNLINWRKSPRVEDKEGGREIIEREISDKENKTDKWSTNNKNSKNWFFQNRQNSKKIKTKEADKNATPVLPQLILPPALVTLSPLNSYWPSLSLLPPGRGARLHLRVLTFTSKMHQPLSHFRVCKQNELTEWIRFLFLLELTTFIFKFHFRYIAIFKERFIESSVGICRELVLGPKSNGSLSPIVSSLYLQISISDSTNYGLWT